MQFDFQEDPSASIIKVIGIGGGGNNAVNFMYNLGISGVNFVVCNTDAQALEKSPVPTKIQLGPSLTDGRGAGAVPEVGKAATLESEEDIRTILSKNTKMCFVTAGMGGGTGTGGAPVVARIARELGILTVGIVTVPFEFEGKSKREKAANGLDELKENVDAIIVISNNKLKEIYGNLSLTDAFSQADNILATAAKGISEIITKPGLVNVDFEDVKTVMKNSGVAIMGSGSASGENRALKAIDAALTSPLLSDNDIYGARGILLYINSGLAEVTMDEVSQITGLVQQAASNDTELIWGICHDESLGDEIQVTLIATGFQTGMYNTKKPTEVVKQFLDQEVEKKVQIIEEEKKEEKFEPELTTKKEDEPILTNKNGSFTLFNKAEREVVTPVSPEKKQFDLFGQTQPAEDKISDDEFQRLHMERLRAIKSMVNMSKLKNSDNITELERIPAYERQNMQINNDKMYSSESHFSTFNLEEKEPSESNSDRFELRKNSFLDEITD